MMRKTEELREALLQSRSGQARWCCPEDLREEVIGYAKIRRSAGDSVVTIARELGISESGLNRWLQKSAGIFRPVRVKEAPSGGDCLSLVTPAGYRLEGLSPASAAEVLRRLGC